jgi:hypothetical protein
LITARYFSSCPSDSTSRWTPCPPESYQLLSGQRGITPAFGYDAPHPSVRGTLTLLNSVLLSTPYGRSDSCSPNSSRPFPGGEGWLLHEQVSLIYAPGLPALPSPPTCGCFVSSGHVTHRRIEPRLLPHGSSPNGNSGLRLSSADSPHLTGRIEFLIVRTSSSPPAAPHPVSPRRSCRLITSYVVLKRTLTSLIGCALRRTGTGVPPVTFIARVAMLPAARTGPSRASGRGARAT